MRFAYHVGIISLLGSLTAAAGAAELQAVVYGGLATPLSGVKFDYFSVGSPTMNASGELAFTAHLTGTGVTSTNAYSLWKGQPGNFSLVSRQGVAAPGTISLCFSVPGELPPKINSAGAVAFPCGLQTASGGAVPTASDTGFWTTAGGGLNLVAREGDAAGSSGRYYGSGSFVPPQYAFDSAGRVISDWELSSGTGLFLHSGGTTQILGLSGLSAAGYSAGTYYGNFATGCPVVNSAGLIVVRHQFSNLADGILGSTGGPLQPLVRAGTPLSPGNTLTFSGFSQPSINDGGSLAFQANISGPSTDNSNNTAIVVGKDNTFTMAAREGDTVPGTAAQYAFGFSNYTIPTVMVGGAGHIAFRAPLGGSSVTTANNLALLGGLPDSLHVLGRKGEQAAGLPEGFLYENFDRIYVNAVGQVAFAGTARNGSALYSAFWLGTPDGQTSLIAGTGSLVNVGGTMFPLETVYTTGIGSGGQDGGPSAFTDDGRLAFAGTYGGRGVIIVASVPEPGTFVGAAALALMLVQRRRRCQR